MKRYDFAYPVGVICCLERKLLPPRRFFEFLSSDLGRVLSTAKEYFFQTQLSPLQTIEDMELFLEKEENILNNLLEEYLEKDFFKEFQNFFNYQSTNQSLFGDYPFLLYLFKMRLDFFNIIFFLRAGYLNKEFSPQFFGFLSEDDISRLFSEDKVFKIKNPEFFDFFSTAKSFVKEKKYFLLDYLPFKFFIKVQEKAKRIILGPERLFSFYFFKKLQDKLIKIIFSCKLYKLEEERIRKILEVIYA